VKQVPVVGKRAAHQPLDPVQPRGACDRRGKQSLTSSAAAAGAAGGRRPPARRCHWRRPKHLPLPPPPTFHSHTPGTLLVAFWGLPPASHQGAPLALGSRCRHCFQVRPHGRPWPRCGRRPGGCPRVRSCGAGGRTPTPEPPLPSQRQPRAHGPLRYPLPAAEQAAARVGATTARTQRQDALLALGRCAGWPFQAPACCARDLVAPSLPGAKHLLPGAIQPRPAVCHTQPPSCLLLSGSGVNAPWGRGAAALRAARERALQSPRCLPASPPPELAPWAASLSARKPRLRGAPARSEGGDPPPRLPLLARGCVPSRPSARTGQQPLLRGQPSLPRGRAWQGRAEGLAGPSWVLPASSASCWGRVWGLRPPTGSSGAEGPTSLRSRNPRRRRLAADMGRVTASRACFCAWFCANGQVPEVPLPPPNV